jgi:hypothetical protein
VENTAADTIGQLLAAACQRFRDRPALVRGTETVPLRGAELGMRLEGQTAAWGAGSPRAEGARRRLD